MATLTHGPLLADLGPDHVQVWLRTDAPAEVRVDVTPLGGVVQPGAPQMTGGDHTASLLVPGLQPGISYQAEVFVDGVPAGLRQFTTLPPAGDPAELRLVFFSDTFRAYEAPALATIRGMWPLGVFIIGDHDHENYVANNVSTAAGALIRARTFHRVLRDDSTLYGADCRDYIIDSGVPILGHIADDHDCGQDNKTKAGKFWPQVLQAMREYWPVSADHGYDAGYMYSSVRLGRTLVALLDTRTHREMPGTHRALLGEGQWVWLAGLVAQVLVGEPIDRMILVSPVPVNPNQHKLDSWYGYADERQRLLDTVAPLLPRVLVMSGDCHWGSIVSPPLAPLWEINGPKLQANGFANTCNHQAAQWSQTSVAAGGGFTLLTIRPDGITATIYNADGTVRLEAVAP